jgi:hypothetical protein
MRGDAEISPDDDYSFADLRGAEYGADLRAHDKPGESLVVVTLRPTKINAVNMNAWPPPPARRPARPVPAAPQAPGARRVPTAFHSFVFAGTPQITRKRARNGERKPNHGSSPAWLGCAGRAGGCRWSVRYVT